MVFAFGKIDFNRNSEIYFIIFHFLGWCNGLIFEIKHISEIYPPCLYLFIICIIPVLIFA